MTTSCYAYETRMDPLGYLPSYRAYSVISPEVLHPHSPRNAFRRLQDEGDLRRGFRYRDSRHARLEDAKRYVDGFSHRPTYVTGVYPGPVMMHHNNKEEAENKRQQAKQYLVRASSENRGPKSDIIPVTGSARASQFNRYSFLS